MSTLSQDLSELMNDATRFISAFYKVIAYSPVQIYRSALLFTPRQTVLRQKYISTIKLSVAVVGRHEETWGPSVNVIEGHSSVVTSVAFSHDGTRIVSGSRDKTVRVWNSSSGAELFTSTRLMAVHSVAFFDGNTHIKGVCGYQVGLWTFTTTSSPFNDRPKARTTCT
jgi:WD40 repeat protein